MTVPPVDHIIYIPIAIAIGVMIGWRIGARAVQSQWDRAEKRRRLEEEGA